MSVITQAYQILLIDDEYQEWIDTLQFYEEYFNFSFVPSASVEEAIDKLKEMHAVIDAIILDLRFPSGKIQGEKALEYFKTNYPDLPVFILTGTDHPDDTKKINDLLAKGADDYFHKHNFDPEKLMIEIGRIVSQKRMQERLNWQKKNKNKRISPPYLLITDDQPYQATFAFQLTQSVDTGDIATYYQWINDFLKTLALSDKKLQVSQILYSPAKDAVVQVYWVFRLIAGTEEEIYELFDDVLFDFSYFFYEKDIMMPAIFKPVVSQAHLEQIFKLISRKEKTEHTLIKRKAVKKPLPGSFGYKTANDNDQIEIGHIQELLTSSFNRLFHLLSQFDDTFIRTDIKKIRLKKEEVKALNNLSMLISNTKEDQVAIEDLFRNQEMLYHITTTLFSPQDVPLNLLNSISDTFYSGKAQFEKIQPGNFAELDAPLKRFLYLYSSTSALNVYRLPYFTKDAYSIIPVADKRELQLPVSALNPAGILVGRHHWGKVFIDHKQFQKHTYIIGKTGTGKTSVLYRMFMDRVEAGQGVALIDPHGDIFQKIKRDIPDNRKKDVIIFDPTDPDSKFGFNYLNYDKKFPEQRTFLIDELIKIFDDLYDLKRTGGPMFEMYFRRFTLLVMCCLKNPTLYDIVRVFSDRKLLFKCIDLCGGRELLEKYFLRQTSLFKSNEYEDYMNEEWEEMDFINPRTDPVNLNLEILIWIIAVLETSGEQSFENFVPYITSKLTRFLDNDFLAPFLMNRYENTNFRELIDDNKILLVHLNKGKLGDLGVNFIGRLLFNKIIMAVYTRSDIPEEQRKDFTLFIDEFQNFTSRDIVTALGETRKYRLQLVLANQTFAQLDDKTARNILSNVGSIITAAVSPFDAEMIVPFLKPDFTDLDLIKLDNYKFILKTLYNNKQVEPIIFESIPY